MADQTLSGDERIWAMWALLCGLAWLFAGSGLLFVPIGAFTLFTILGPLMIWRSRRETMPIAEAQVHDGKLYRYPFYLRLVT